MAQGFLPQSYQAPVLPLQSPRFIILTTTEILDNLTGKSYELNSIVTTIPGVLISHNSSQLPGQFPVPPVASHPYQVPTLPENHEEYRQVHRGIDPSAPRQSEQKSVLSTPPPVQVLPASVPPAAPPQQIVVPRMFQQRPAPQKVELPRSALSQARKQSERVTITLAFREEEKSSQPKKSWLHRLIC